MRKAILAGFLSLLLIPGAATLARADNPGNHDNHGTESGGGGGNPNDHDQQDTEGSKPSGNPTNHDQTREVNPPPPQ